ncbi:NfeD family protein, partial [Enterobacter sp. R1(2018)]|uniref:NfeD family protein n=1 Tax=Enterobacter sp. R1(2018) TaxID=2447891 RepID=UPI00217E248B
VCFALLTLVAAFLWWRWLSTRKQQEPGEVLNQRGHQLVGRHLRLETTLVNGRGHIRVADSSWPVMADSDLPAGTEVVVVAVEGITLKIQAL